MKREGIPGPILDGDIGQPGSRSKVEIVHATGERPEPVRALKTIHDGHPTVPATHNQRVRKNGRSGPLNPMKNFQRERDLGIRRNKKKGTAGELCFVKSGVFMGSQLDRLGHEIFFEERLVFTGSHFQGAEDHAFGKTGRVLMKERVVAKNHLACGFFQAARGDDKSAFIRDGWSLHELREV